MQKLLLFPIRLAVGWGLSPRLLSLLGVVMLVLLRVTIGLHFYSEGLDKYQSGTFDASPFFANARGPLASEYHKLVWDYDGSVRTDVEKTKMWWAQFRDRVGRHYGFDEKQTQLAQANYSNAVDRLNQVYLDEADAIEEFGLGIKRMESLNEDQSRDGVASLGGQRDTIRRELIALGKPVFAKIDSVWDNYENAQNDLANEDQRLSNPPLSMGKPAIGLMDTNRMNKIVPYFDLAIGICLLFGLFTPLAALAAAGFLGSVFLGQFPPSVGPTSTYYQLVESMACLVLAATGAGRFAGLDYFFHLIVRKVWGTSPEKG